MNVFRAALDRIFGSSSKPLVDGGVRDVKELSLDNTTRRTLKKLNERVEHVLREYQELSKSPNSKQKSMELNTVYDQLSKLLSELKSLNGHIDDMKNYNGYIRQLEQILNKISSEAKMSRLNRAA